VLNAVAVGVLVFLLVDVLGHANEATEDALVAATGGTAGWGRFVLLAAVFATGVAAGLVGLVYYDRWTRRRGQRLRFGPGAAHEAELATPASSAGEVDSGRTLALLIAVGIGLHNLSEGLAIGQSAAAGDVSLALLLIIGFGLHNATEGFGIVAPLTGQDQRPSWGYLAGLGLIGGGPTFLGTILGQWVVNDVLFVAFLALAAGSILYVVIQLLRVAARQGFPVAVTWGIFAGLAVGFATDYVLVAAGL
jgi:ZIP family zinc transporter